MKKIYYLICCCIFPLCVSAYDAEINGIYYNLEVSEKMATVTQKYDSESNQSAYYGDVIIPSTIIYNGETYNVKNIGNAAFFNCANVTSVTIPKSIIRIGDAAFANCTGLDAVYISDFDAWCAASISREGGNPLNYANHLYLNGAGTLCILTR